MPLVDVKIEVPEGYELTDKEPVHVSKDELYLNARGDVLRWKNTTRTLGKYFRVRKIQEQPKVEVRLKPGWIAKGDGGYIYWFESKPGIYAGVYHSTNSSPCRLVSDAIDVEFPEGVTLMEVE